MKKYLLVFSLIVVFQSKAQNNFPFPDTNTLKSVNQMIRFLNFKLIIRFIARLEKRIQNTILFFQMKQLKFSIMTLIWKLEIPFTIHKMSLFGNK